MEMKMRVISTGLDIARKSFVLMSGYDAEELSVYPLEMVVVRKGDKEYAAFVEIGLVGRGEIVVSKELARLLDISNKDVVVVRKRGEIESKKFIRKKIEGKVLAYGEYEEIVKDTIARRLNDLELASFVTALHIHGMSVREMADMSMAMVNAGKTLKLRSRIVADKHSIGGVPGDKTSLLVIPIVSSLGIRIPKTSSRAITSPAGTADREEVIMRNSLSLEEMKKVVESVNGCLVWGGALELSPADDLFITIEKPLRLDPLFVPSIMSKKKAVGATHLVLDIPTGREAKVASMQEAREIARRFRMVGKRMGIAVRAVATNAEQPLGRYIGPALEAYEALKNLERPEERDVVEKAVAIAGMLISMVKGMGYREGREMARKQLESGKAYRQLVRIAKAQGARATKPEEIEFGKHSEDIVAEKSGYVSAIHNRRIVDISRILGAPRMHGAGIVLHKKVGEYVEKDERIMTLYSESRERLSAGVSNAESSPVFGYSKDKPRTSKTILGII